MDGVVTSVIRAGFFVDCGSLQAFVGRTVRVPPQFGMYLKADLPQMIPTEIKFDANATPPQWTDNGDQVIEKGTNIRIKIKGLRSEVDKMYAIGTMKEVCPAHPPVPRDVSANKCFAGLSRSITIVRSRCRFSELGKNLSRSLQASLVLSPCVNVD